MILADQDVLVLLFQLSNPFEHNPRTPATFLAIYGHEKWTEADLLTAALL